MRALVLRGATELIVRDDAPDPQPDFGQVLAQVKACGICGSDLHFVQHAATMLGLVADMEGLPDFGAPPLDLGRDVFMGHEFAAEVLEVGPDTVGPPPGTIVTSVPIMLTSTGLRDIVYSNDIPAGYGERILLSAPIPDRLTAWSPTAIGSARAAWRGSSPLGTTWTNGADRRMRSP